MFYSDCFLNFYEDYLDKKWSGKKNNAWAVKNRTYIPDDAIRFSIHFMVSGASL